MNNQEIIALIKNFEFYVKTKHIDIYHHFIREVKFCRLIYLNYIFTSNIVINRLIKSFLILKFIYFINLINLINH